METKLSRCLNLLLMLTCALALSLDPRDARGSPGEVDATELAAYDLAMKTFWGRIDPSSKNPIKSHRELRRSIPILFDWNPWDYYGQRGHHFQGDILIDTGTGDMAGTITVDVVVNGNDHESLYFWTGLPVTAVRDGDGLDVAFEETYSWGIKLTRLDLVQPPADGAELSFAFDMEGVPECAYAGVISVHLCAFSDISYLAMSLFLPGSLAGDFATFDLNVTVPEGLTVASSGVNAGMTPADLEGHEVHHLIQDFPTEAHSMVLAKYRTWDVPYEEKTISVHTVDNPLIDFIVPGVLTDMRDILSFFADQFGAFQFPKMEAAQITQDAGAAFGWPALLWIPDTMFLMGGSSGGSMESNHRTALFAHELGHQWFPDMLKSDDPYGSAWLSEGWAEFSSIYYMSQENGEDYLEGVFDYYGMLYQYFAAPHPKDYGLTSEETGDLGQNDGWLYQINTYYKGAVIANTIRQVIGQTAFIKGLRNLYNDYAGKDDYYDTGTLQVYFQDAWGGDLQWLFDQWIYGTGYPIYKVHVTRTEGEQGQAQASVRVERTGNEPGRVFDMPATIQLVTLDGDVDNKEWIDQDDATFTWDVDSRLVRVRFDPDRTFIKRVVPGLPGDVDLSGEVDGIDLIYTAWGQEGLIGQSPNFLPWVDFDGDGVVGTVELEQVTGNFGDTSQEVAL